MIDFRIIEEYLMTYVGIHYKKPIDKNDEMTKIKLNGKNSRENFIKLGSEVLRELSGFSNTKCSSWIKVNQVIPNYLWIQFKKDGYEKCPSSISLAIKKVKGEVYLYVAVEIKDKDAEVDDFTRHNKILDTLLTKSELYYSVDDDEYFNLGSDIVYVKELIKRKEVMKVRIQKNIENYLRKDENDIVNEIITTIKILEPYYDRIISDFDKNNKFIEGKKESTQNDKFKKNKSENMYQSSTAWIIPCNPSSYDVVGAFNELKKIEWKQSVNIKVGDSIYIRGKSI